MVCGKSDLMYGGFVLKNVRLGCVSSMYVFGHHGTLSPQAREGRKGHSAIKIHHSALSSGIFKLHIPPLAAANSDKSFRNSRSLGELPQSRLSSMIMSDLRHWCLLRKQRMRQVRCEVVGVLRTMRDGPMAVVQFAMRGRMASGVVGMSGSIWKIKI